MCCSVSPEVEVKFSDTILYAAEIVNPQNKIVHVLGYQNKAQNHINRFNPAGLWRKVKDLFAESTGNAMLLPFPCLPGTMSSANILETKNCPDILKDIAIAVKPPAPQSANYQMAAQSSFSRSAPVEIFKASGIYTVVLAQDARDIPQALNRVPKEKRPKLNPELFEAYAKWYPNWTFALCCFNNESLQEALPMLWWYEPMNSDDLFLPALDGHTGDIPNFDSEVMVDHTVAVGSGLARLKPLSASPLRFCPVCSVRSSRPENLFCLQCEAPLPAPRRILAGTYQKVFYKNEVSVSKDVKPYLLPQVLGEVFQKSMPNGDFVCRIEEVRKGIWNPVRTVPNF
jgi:hypothetical protein